MDNKLLFTVFLMVFASTGCAQEKTIQKRVVENKKIGSLRWIMKTQSGMRFQLVQRIPDQTRSFYNVRGFPLEAADKYAAACVMQTIFNNNSQDLVASFNLADWNVIHNGKSRPMKLTKQWLEEWTKLDVPQSARIAFRWSQFPTEQTHKPGDWFQGMIAANLPPGSKFDLEIRWKENGDMHSATMKDVLCATDRNLGDIK